MSVSDADTLMSQWHGETHFVWETNHMTAFTMNDDILNTIAGNEKTIAGLKSNASDLNGQAGEVEDEQLLQSGCWHRACRFHQKSNLPACHVQPNQG